jgi:PadR family transcriptional regulator, regulatory protein PadR
MRVLTEFLQTPEDWKYGYDITRGTGLKSGTLYPILMRMAERGLLETRWEASQAGKPPRHMYKLAPCGVKYAREALPAKSKSRAQAAFRQPALGGAQDLV